MLDQHLSASVTNLKDESMKLYSRYLSYLDTLKEELEEEGDSTAKIESSITMILSEQSYCFLHFYKNEKAEACLTEATKLSKLNIQFSGKMGKRTRFQQRDIAQLTVDFDSRDVRLNIQDVNSSINTLDEEKKDEESAGVFLPDIETAKYLQKESIFYAGEVPKFVDGHEERKLTETDLILLHAFTFYQYIHLPKDEHREIIMRPLL